ncbi:hypothetical protein GGR58DRAFT_380467 [Xylaria digitata]|nr:hypothetical protein GGR58DRAFT_380467 [Xylaria digitata]
MSTEKKRDEFAQFWSNHVIAINMDPGRLHDHQSAVDPLSFAPDQQNPTFEYLAACLARFQVHLCTLAYCFRKKRRRQAGEPGADPLTKAQIYAINQNLIESRALLLGNAGPAALRRLAAAHTLLADLHCRFYFPRMIRDSATVDKSLNPRHWNYVAQRNDERLNSYNPAISLGWLANTNISPCCDYAAAVNYMAKYCSKAETMTKSYQDLIQEILPRISDRRPLLSLVMKMMNKLVGERDMSSQEIMHMLFNLPLQQSSRTAQSVDCRAEEFQPHQYIAEGGEVSHGNSLLEKYKKRPVNIGNLAAVTYFQWLTKYSWDSQPPRPRPRAQDRILIYFPKYKRETASEDYCRVKMMLHHPFGQEGVSSTKIVDGHQYNTYAEAYAA